MVVQRSFCAYTPLESINQNIFVNILFFYHLRSQKVSDLVIHTVLSLLAILKRRLLSQGDKTGIFRTVQKKLWSKEDINWINLMFLLFQSLLRCNKTYNFVVNIELLLLWRGFQTFHMFILGHFWRLFKFSFMTRNFFESILEPPIVSYFKTIQCYSHSRLLSGFKTAKTSPWDSDLSKILILST